MSNIYIRNYNNSDRKKVYSLFESISKMYKNIVFWWPGEDKSTREYVYCAFKEKDIIGKGQVMPINIISENSLFL